MPPLKAVERLEKLCSWTLANHLFGVFCSWYNIENSKSISKRKSHRHINEKLALCNHGSAKVKIEELQDLLNNCIEEKNSSIINEDWYLKHLVCSTSYSDDPSNEPESGTLSPVQQEYQTVNVITQWLAKEVQEFLSCYLAPRFHEKVLASVLNVVASKIEIPRPKEKLRVFEEDLEFLNSLSFLLKVSLQCLLVKGVMALDFSHIAHILKRWKLLCWGGETLNRNGKECESPCFDIFGYAVDSKVVGMRTLKYIKLPHYVHNSFVRKIAYLCPNLEVLILRCSADCTNPKSNVPVVTNVEVLYGNSAACGDGHVRMVPGCRDLVTLALPEGVETLDVTNDAIEMLSFMPNLEYLVGVPMIYVTEEFEELLESLPGAQKLTNFHHGVYGNDNWPYFAYEEFLQEPDPEYLSKVFTQVTKVGIYAPTEVTEKVLESFTRAQDITVFTDDFEVHGKYMRNLTNLDINVGYQEEWPILNSLCQTSPGLEQLTLRSFSLIVSGTSDQKPRFPSLHTLRFHGQNVLQGEALIFFLQGCPQLTTFVLSMITDEDGEYLLDDQTLLQAVPLLPNLQKFVYKVQSALTTVDRVPSSLTMKSCDALLNGCTQLFHVGNLETWKISKSEIIMLQEKVKKKNWDLEIA